MNCSGPDGTAYSVTQGSCVGGINTSCDSVARDTCYYAFLLNGVWFGGYFDSDGVFTLCCCGLLPDVQPGDQILQLGYRRKNDQWEYEDLVRNEKPNDLGVLECPMLQRYTEEKRAGLLRFVLYRPSNGTNLAVTWRGVPK